jgi:hypothetical protein
VNGNSSAGCTHAAHTCRVSPSRMHASCSANKCAALFQARYPWATAWRPPPTTERSTMPKLDTPEDVQRAADAHQVIDLLAAGDAKAAVRIIAQYCGPKGQFALDIAAAAVTQLDEANDPDCAPIPDNPDDWDDEASPRLPNLAMAFPHS